MVSELEVVLRVKTDTWVGLGWRPSSKSKLIIEVVLKVKNSYL